MKTELILNHDESLELKTMQDKLLEISKEKRQLKYKIECFINRHSVEIKTQKASSNFVERDIQLIKNYLEKNGPSLTRDLCFHLNKELENEFKRWNPNNLKNVKLDSGMFYGYFNPYLYNNGINKEDKYWKLK